MTRASNARIAGATFLAYIVTGVLDGALFAKVSMGSDAASKLASLAQHPTTVRLCALLELLTFFEAAALGVTLYALTRDEDVDLALLAFGCRLAEGVLGATAAVGTMRLISVANAAAQARGSGDLQAARALGASMLAQGGSSGTIGAICFAVGSAIFAYLFLRSRSIPVGLAALGVAASILLVVALPVQVAGFLPRALVWPIWMPMLAFEVTLAFWMLIKGVDAPAFR
jgi:hypothetical protein